MPSSDSFPLFLVEDSDDDLFLFKRLLTKAGATHPLSVATNGQSAIDQMAAIVAANNPASVPRIVFIDLKLPLRSGFEVLEYVRGQPLLRTSAAIILSSSAEARDVKRAYELGAHGYLVKYPGPPVFRDIIAAVATLPGDAAPDGLSFPGMARPV